MMTAQQQIDLRQAELDRAWAENYRLQRDRDELAQAFRRFVGYHSAIGYEIGSASHSALDKARAALAKVTP